MGLRGLGCGSCGGRKLSGARARALRRSLGDDTGFNWGQFAASEATALTNALAQRIAHPAPAAPTSIGSSLGTSFSLSGIDPTYLALGGVGLLFFMVLLLRR